MNDNEVSLIYEKLSNAWHDVNVAEKQRLIVENQLQEYRQGRPNKYFDGLVDILNRNIANLENKKLLEIGCSSGYYSEIFRIRGISALYRGCDYSEPFIQLARNIYPEQKFDIEDATKLSYGAASFDIVVSATCLLHISEYERAISEAARVSSKYVIFFNTPVLHSKGPIVYSKVAYGVDMFEIHFNEQKLVELFSKYRLRIADMCTHSIMWKVKYNDALAMKTYFCEKIA